MKYFITGVDWNGACFQYLSRSHGKQDWHIQPDADKAHKCQSFGAAKRCLDIAMELNRELTFFMEVR